MCNDREEKPAHFRCIQCSLEFSYFRAECLHHHNKTKAMRTNAVVALEEYKASYDAGEFKVSGCHQMERCQKHFTKPLDVFCSTCEKLIC